MKYLLNVILFLVILILGNDKVFANDYDFVHTDVPLDKKWTITFSENVDSKSINYESIKVKDRYGDELHIFLSTDFFQPNKVAVQAITPYKYDTEYFLYVSDTVKNQSGQFINKPTTMKFKTVKNPNLGNLSIIKTASDLVEYLNANYSVIDTPTGKWELGYKYQGGINTKLILRTNWSGGSPYTLHRDDKDLEILDYGRPITAEEKEATKQILRELQAEVATIAMTAFPNTPIEGGFYSGGYKYPNLQLDYWSIPFLSWKNYYGDAYGESNVAREFHWNPKNDDYNFVLNKPIKKIYVVDERNNRQVAYEDWDKDIVIKKGEKIKFVFDQAVSDNLTYNEIGLTYTYSDYSKKEIIKVDEKGNIIGNKIGKQNVMVSYHWDPYVSHYFTIIVEE